MPGVGKLVLVNRKARIGRNPATGQPIQIPAKRVVKFRVAKAAKDAILGDALGAERILGGQCNVFVAVEAPGVIRHAGGGTLAFGELDGRPSERAARVLARARQRCLPAHAYQRGSGSSTGVGMGS